MQALASKALIPLGLVILATHNVLQWLVSRGGHASDQSDFLLGAFFGIGAGLTLLGIWRNRPGSRCTLSR